MDKCVLLAPDDRCIPGNSVVDVVLATGVVQFDLCNRRAVIYGVPDTVSFSEEYTPGELIRGLAGQALKRLKQRGFQLFKNVDWE